MRWLCAGDDGAVLLVRVWPRWPRRRGRGLGGGAGLLEGDGGLDVGLADLVGDEEGGEAGEEAGEQPRMRKARAVMTGPFGEVGCGRDESRGQPRAAESAVGDQWQG